MKLSRILRERLGLFKQQLLSILGSDKSKLKPLKSYFKKSKTIFIHIPKCAGTSVASALYGTDPWHFSVKSYSEKVLNEYTCFAVIRDPVDRFYSSYNYLCSRSHLYPNSLYSDASNCKDIEDFFNKFIKGKNDDEINYFMRSQYWYLSDNSGKIRVKNVINMNRLDSEFPKSIREIFSFYDDFPQKNVLSKKTSGHRHEDLNKEIRSHYKKDYEILKNHL